MDSITACKISINITVSFTLSDDMTILQTKVSSKLYMGAATSLWMRVRLAAVADGVFVETIAPLA